MRYLLFAVIGYLVLYSTVWLHEVGHSLWDCLFGVKQGWWKVNVKPYIFFSTPGEVDMEAWNNLNAKQYALIAYGGILANAIWALAAGVIIKAVPIHNLYMNMALWLFMTLHTCEIVSYLFIGSIYLVSDMQIIAQVMPKLRIVNICAGALLTVFYIALLINVPSEFQVFIIIWNAVTLISMCAGRIIFSIKSNRASSSEG